MKNSFAAMIALTLSNLAAGYAGAAETGLTGAQVRAERLAAQRRGELVGTHNHGG